MRLFLVTALILCVGGLIHYELFNGKSADFMYRLRTSPGFAAPLAASELLETADRARFKALTDAEKNRLVLEEFSRAVLRMKWTESGELEWDEGKGSQQTGSPP
jgi:hypothetical protein